MESQCMCLIPINSNSVTSDCVEAQPGYTTGFYLLIGVPCGKARSVCNYNLDRLDISS